MYTLLCILNELDTHSEYVISFKICGAGCRTQYITGNTQWEEGLAHRCRIKIVYTSLESCGSYGTMTYSDREILKQNLIQCLFTESKPSYILPVAVNSQNYFIKQESPPAWTQEAYRPPRGHSNFLLLREGVGPLTKIFFFQSEHVLSQIWCQKIFPLLGGGSLDKNYFFPVWTCIKPNLVSKNFPFTRGGPSTKNFFFQSEHVSSQIWCQKIFPLLGGGGGPLTKNFFFQSEKFSLYQGGVPSQNFFFPVWTCIKPNLVSKNFPFTRGGG